MYKISNAHMNISLIPTKCKFCLKLNDHSQLLWFDVSVLTHSPANAVIVAWHHVHANVVHLTETYTHSYNLDGKQGAFC